MQLSFLDIEQTGGEKAIWFETMLLSLNISADTAWPDRFGAALYNRLSSQHIPRIRTLSLFSGGGGLDIAFHDAGFAIVEMVEINSRYIETLRRNFASKSKITCADIREYTPEIDHPIDFIIGGPPCQTFSAAGRRAAGVAGTDDPRGALFEEYIRLLLRLRPKGFLFENVYGITGAQNGQAWKDIQAAFKAAGYTIFFRVLDAADYGVPQHRERLFIVGTREGTFLFPYPTHGPDSIGQHPYYPAGTAIEGIDAGHTDQGIGGRYGHLLNDIPPGLNYSFYTREMGHPSPVFSWRSKFSDFLYKADPEQPVRTIKAQGGQYTGPFSWENRPFTVSELKRLQTFPDLYEIVGGRQVCIEQIGNSVPPQLGRLLAMSILDQLFSVSLPFDMHYLPETKTLGFRQRKRALTEIYASKAQEALEGLQREHQMRDRHAQKDALSETVTRYLGTDFSWTEDRRSDGGAFCVSFIMDHASWQISISRPAGDHVHCNDTKWSISVYPVIHNSWPLKTNSVYLHADTLDLATYTALWKAFEEKVVETTGVADLVQLSGYYQYQSQIRATVSLHESQSGDPFWNIVKLVTEGIGVGKQLSGDQLAGVWNCSADRLMDYLLRLRSMGFEVRNHATNPQIRVGEYLIPYIFPTFTPQSVQRRKSLCERHVCFVTSGKPERLEELMPRLHDIEEIYGVRVVIVTFAEWVSHQFERASRDGLLLERELASGWLRAYTESIAQRRRELAPIDEPCYEWLRELHAIFTATIDTLLQ